MKKYDTPLQTGFTLAEIAIVMFIMALMLGSSLSLLSAQQDQQKIDSSKIKLDEIREALIGYAIINGRLPCPATTTSNGHEDPIGGGNCSHFYDGFVPARTLSIEGVDSAGYLNDSLGNPIHYAVTSSNSNAFTTANGMSAIGISNLTPDLQVCSTATGISGSPPNCSSGPPSTSLTSNGVPAVIYSTGMNGSTGGTGSDEAANPNPNSANNDRLFIKHALSTANEAGGEFDDQVIWLSSNILFNRLVQAGRLP